MNIAIAASVSPIIFIGELPDKTMFASLVIASRGKPRDVWLGAAAAFTVHVTIATTIGIGLVHVLSHRLTEAVVAVLFLVGAVWSLSESARPPSPRSGETCCGTSVSQRCAV